VACEFGKPIAKFFGDVYQPIVSRMKKLLVFAKSRPLRKTELAHSHFERICFTTMLDQRIYYALLRRIEIFIFVQQKEEGCMNKLRQTSD